MRWLAACLLATAVGLAACASARAAGAEGSPAAKGKIRVLLTYGGHDFEQKPFFAMFDALPGVVYSKAPLPESAAMLKPDLQKQYDVIVMYDMCGKFSPEEQKAFVALLEQGIGVVSLHHNLGAHLGWPEFTKILGGKFLLKAETIGGKTYGPSTYEHGQQIRVTVTDKLHPITRGLADFTIEDETYGKCYIAPDAHVLLRTDNPKNNPSIAWVSPYGKCRVFYFQLGHDSKAWSNPAYPDILSRGICWAAGR
jgi:type 1 glutamine amidotransferase